MANPYLILWFDPSLNRLYTGWNQNTPANQPILKQGDNIGVELHWVKAGSANYPMQEVVFPPAADITLAVGRLDTEPTSGTFKLTYGANTTANLAYDITATDLQTALNGLASITAEGGVVVNKTGSVFRIVWNNASATVNNLSADVNNLSPTSDSQVVVARAGSATDRQIILLSLKQAPMAACTTFTPTPAPAITVESIFTNTWRVSISPNPKTGSFTLTQLVGTTSTTTDPIPYNATATQVQEELNAVLDGYFVIRSGEFSWDITAPSSVVNLTATSALVGYSSMYGVLSMNTAEVEEFLAGAESGEATLEVQADISGEIQTLIQATVTVINDLISTSAFTLVELGDVMPVDSVVRWDTPQVIPAGGQTQARSNIGAAAASDIAALQAEDIVLQGEIDATNTALDVVEAKLDQDVKTTSDVEFASVTNKPLIDTGVRLINGGIQAVFDGAGTGFNWNTSSNRIIINGEEWIYLSQDGGGATSISPEAFYSTSGSSSIEIRANGISFNGSAYQTVPYDPAAIAATYLTIANAASTYGLLANTPTADQKAALAAQSYSTTPPSSTNKYLTKSDFDANFITETHPIATNTGVNHSANNIIATGIIASPDSTKDWLVNVTFNYVGATPDLVSDTFWADTNHELYFEEEGNLGGAQMIFKRSSFSFVLASGVTGYELWSSAHAPFVGASAQLLVTYRQV